MRAIILAAGMGTRLRPLTNDTPKSLVKVAGQPMLERQIEFLREKGIDDIIVVTGYLKNKFDYLKEKYGITLLHNDKYDVYNNLYTMYLVREFLGDSYVTEADVYMRRNYLKDKLHRSTYFTGVKENFKGEWMLRFDERSKVYDIEIGDGTDYILSGVSYWSKEDANLIREKIEDAMAGESFHNLYWDDIVRENIKNIDVYVEKINSDDWFEIDSLEDLRKTEDYLKNI